MRYRAPFPPAQYNQAAGGEQGDDCKSRGHGHQANDQRKRPTVRISPTGVALEVLSDALWKIIWSPATRGVTFEGLDSLHFVSWMTFIVDLGPYPIDVFWSRDHESMTDAWRSFAKIKGDASGHVTHPFAGMTSSSRGQTRSSGISVTYAARILKDCAVNGAIGSQPALHPLKVCVGNGCG